MSKKTNPEAPEMNVDSASKIEAIKNLIFGDNIQQYNSEFLSVKNEIDKQKASLEEYIDQVRGELMQSIDSLSTDVNIRITDLEDALNEKTDTLTENKVDRKELGKLIVSLGEKIGA